MERAKIRAINRTELISPSSIYRTWGLWAVLPSRDARRQADYLYRVSRNLTVNTLEINLNREPQYENIERDRHFYCNFSLF